MFLPLFFFIIYFFLGFCTATHERVCVAGIVSACESSTRSSESITFEGLVLSLSLSSDFFLLLFLFILFYLYFIHPSISSSLLFLVTSFFYRLAHLIVCALLFDLLGLWPNQLTLTIQYVVVVVVVVSAYTEWKQATAVTASFDYKKEEEEHLPDILIIINYNVSLVNSIPVFIYISLEKIGSYSAKSRIIDRIKEIRENWTRIVVVCTYYMIHTTSLSLSVCVYTVFFLFSCFFVRLFSALCSCYWFRLECGQRRGG